MSGEIKNRVILLATYVLKFNATVRQTAKVFGVSKSTVHNDLSKRLRKINMHIYKKIQVIFNNNFNEKHLRGGNATKEMYSKKTNIRTNKTSLI